MCEVFRACVENVRELKSKQRILNKLINDAIRNNRTDYLDTLTKMYALLYSSYAEISFLKLIYTPCGFGEDEIKEIIKKSTLEDKWNKCFDIAMYKIYGESDEADVIDKKIKLKTILEKYIIYPSKIRNKIAHGQWESCLNSKNERVNYDMTREIKSLDCVKIGILFNVYDRFQQCIEDMIESPRTHQRDYKTIIDNLEAYVTKTMDWNLESKRNKIRNSPKNRNR